MIAEYKQYGFKGMCYKISNILYIKWYLKQCRHLCDMCVWWDECKAHYSDEYEHEKK